MTFSIIMLSAITAFLAISSIIQAKRISFLYTFIETMMESNLETMNHALAVREMLKEKDVKENEDGRMAEESTHH